MVQVILSAGCEGGDVTLYGVRVHDGWRFSRRMIDQTPMVIDEPAIEHETPLVDSWTEALALIDRYPWHEFLPLEVHPEFAARVWTAVQARLQAKDSPGRYLDRWREACGLTP
jgi:hypothetical protein